MAELRRYGAWAGDPEGRLEDLSRCIECVRDSVSYHSYQCRHKRGYGPNGEYCKQHDPAKRQAARDRARMKFDAGPTYRTARANFIKQARAFLSTLNYVPDDVRTALEALDKAEVGLIEHNIPSWKVW